jgi:hypothetical protein
LGRKATNNKKARSLQKEFQAASQHIGHRIVPTVAPLKESNQKAIALEADLPQL